jgi:hypothetical protein
MTDKHRWTRLRCNHPLRASCSEVRGFCTLMQLGR